jgi:hypothetical protein
MDGSDFPTLPVICDPLAAGEGQEEVRVGDSFDIAVHLQETYLSKNPDGPQLFPAAAAGDAGSIALTRAWNLFVDEVFQTGAILAGFYMPFDPKTAEADKASFVARFPGLKKTWEEFEIPAGSDMRNQLLKKFEADLNDKLARCFEGGDGPFVGGRDKPMYADFVVGGWLQFMRGCLPEWEDMRNKWTGGRWGRLLDALEPWTQVDGREGVVPKRG